MFMLVRKPIQTMQVFIVLPKTLSAQHVIYWDTNSKSSHLANHVPQVLLYSNKNFHHIYLRTWDANKFSPLFLYFYTSVLTVYTDLYKNQKSYVRKQDPICLQIVIDPGKIRL